MKAVWRWPVAIAAVTSIGLVAGLLSEGGFGDGLAWLGLSVPVIAAAWYSLK